MIKYLKKTIKNKILGLINEFEATKIKKAQNSFLSQNPHIDFSNIPKDKLKIFAIFGKKLGNIEIGEHFSVRNNGFFLVAENAKLKIGNNVFFNNNCSINCLQEIEIGNNCQFGEGVKFYDHNHLITKKGNIEISRDLFTTAPIKVGANCWIASNVVILKGVTIGDHVVIGAGCVIHKSIPANSIVKNNQNLIIESY